MPTATQLSEYSLGTNTQPGGVITDMSPAGAGTLSTIDTAPNVNAYARAMIPAAYSDGQEFWMTVQRFRKTRGLGLYSRIAAVDSFTDGIATDSLISLQVNTDDTIEVLTRELSGTAWTGLFVDSNYAINATGYYDIELRIVLGDPVAGSTTGRFELFVNQQMLASGTGRTHNITANSGNMIKSRAGISAIAPNANPVAITHEIGAYSITPGRLLTNDDSILGSTNDSILGSLLS